MTSDFPPITDCVPHRGPMLLIERVTAYADDAIQVAAHVDPRAWYADAQSGMPAWIGIELMAQSIAAHIGMRARQGRGSALPGVLLGTRRYTFSVPRFPAGAVLQISARSVLWTAEGHGAYECAIRAIPPVSERASEAPSTPSLAEGVIKVYQPADLDSLHQRSVAP